MADNYTQFSALLPLENDKQKEWVARYLPLLTEGGESPEPALLDELKGVVPRSLVAELEAYFDNLNPCDADFVKEGLWVYSDCSGSPELAAVFIAIVMAYFHIEERVTLSWAEVCSKLRIGEFCGGTFVISCDGYAGCGPLEQIHYCHRLLDDAVEGGKKDS